MSVHQVVWIAQRLTVIPVAYGPPDTIDDIFSKIDGAKAYDQQQGLYSFPCDSAPEVSFRWGGKDWKISADK